MFTVVAAASAEMPIVPVPLASVIAPLVEVSVRAPDPDLIAVEDVELVEPKVAVFTPAPVERFTVGAAASAQILTPPVPDANVITPVVDGILSAPEPGFTAIGGLVRVAPN